MNKITMPLFGCPEVDECQLPECSNQELEKLISVCEKLSQLLEKSYSEKEVKISASEDIMR